ncbi:MAG: REP element-mobilizing transposase RayT [Akkermansiaceae bacterium]
MVHRQFLFQDEEKEQFRVLMRMYERFSGCRVLSYSVMTNHFHLLLEVPPPSEDGEFGISEEELIHRLGGLYSRTYVSGVVAEILEARLIADGKREGFLRLSKEDQAKERVYGRSQLAAIFERYTKRMHRLSGFMQGLLQRFTRWFNKRHGMRGTLWEDRFHSVIVQSGFTCRTMTAYIDLNPVRAEICDDPADYRWSSYGEAVGGGRGAAKAQSGLVRALRGHEGHAGTSRAWAQGGLSKEYRKLLLTNASEQSEISSDGKKRVQRKGMKKKAADKELARLEKEDAKDLKIAKVVSCKVRYFKDGAVLGSKEFVNEFFKSQRERFGPKRKDGARRPRGSLKALAGEIWSLRDLKDG